MSSRARRLYIAAVQDVMKEVDQGGPNAKELAEGLKPFIEIANRMAQKGAKKKPPTKVAAE